MAVTSRGGVSTSDGGAAKTGAPLFPSSTDLIRFLTFRQTTGVEYEATIDGGIEWFQVNAAEGRVNLPLNGPIAATNVRVRPYTDTQTVTVVGWGATKDIK